MESWNKLEELIEKSTGKSCDELRRIPFDQQPIYLRWLKQKAISIKGNFVYLITDVKNYLGMRKLYYKI